MQPLTAPTATAESVSSNTTTAAATLWIQLPQLEIRLPKKNGP
jgi:hypothetical protein